MRRLSIVTKCACALKVPLCKACNVISGSGKVRQLCFGMCVCVDICIISVESDPGFFFFVLQRHTRLTGTHQTDDT